MHVEAGKIEINSFGVRFSRQLSLFEDFQGEILVIQMEIHFSPP